MLVTKLFKGTPCAVDALAVTTVKGYLGNLLGRDEIESLVRDHAG